MAATHTFNEKTLDELINSTSSKVTEIKLQLDTDQQIYTPVLVDDSSIQEDESINLELAHSARDIDFQRVYGELEGMIQTGKDTLDMLNAIDQDIIDCRTLSASATLINSINNLLDQFTKIHLINLKFQQAKELEIIKHNNKLEIIQARNISDGSNAAGITNMIPCSHDLLNEFDEFLAMKEKQQEQNI